MWARAAPASLGLGTHSGVPPRATAQTSSRRIWAAASAGFMSPTPPCRCAVVSGWEPRAFIVLLQGRDEHDPLFLQVKAATCSVLEDHLPKSRFKQPGERVVHGQRMMPAASDINLGWTKGIEANRYLYWRQLRDMKGSAVAEAMTPLGPVVLRRHLRLDAGPSPRPVRRCRHTGRVPWEERQIQPVHHGLLRTIRRQERTGLRGFCRGHPVGPPSSHHRCLNSGPIGVPQTTMARC